MPLDFAFLEQLIYFFGNPILLYTTLFFVLCVGGESTLVPILYATALGYIDIKVVAILYLFSTVASDGLWYTLGRFLPASKVFAIPLLEKRLSLFESVGIVVDSHPAKIVFFSKFVFGTRLITQVLCGMRSIPFLRFMWASLLGASVWLTLLYTLLQVIDYSLSSLKGTVLYLQLLLLLFFSVGALVVYVVSVYAKRTLHIAKE